MTPPTLPGDLPGLLRKGSPVVTARASGSGSCAIPVGLRGVIECQTTGDVGPVVSLTGGPRLPLPCADLALDLSDPTGRAHAAWWWSSRLFAHSEMRGMTQLQHDAMDLLVDLGLGRDMTPAQIDTLRRACMAVGGRA